LTISLDIPRWSSRTLVLELPILTGRRCWIGVTTETLSPNGLVGKIITSNAAGALDYQNATVSTENSIDLSTTNKVVTVAVYSTTL
jgi:hypothetical protein